MSPRARERRWRWLFVASVVAYYSAVALHPLMLRLLGLNFEYIWFLDSHALLAASDAAAAGLNPYRANPFDILGRPHVYSQAWLHLSDIGLTREHNFVLGGFFAGVFFAAAIWWLRPKSAWEAVLCLGVVGSPAVVLGVERGNNDLVIFALVAAVVPMLTQSRVWARWGALAPIMAATWLKFYPAAAIAVLGAAEDRPTGFRRCLIGAGLVGGVFVFLRPELVALAPLMPRAEGLLSFGAEQVFVECGWEAKTAACAGAGLGAAILLPSLLFAPKMECPPEPGRRREWLAFVLGAVVLVGCFFARPSYSYRFVYVVLMLPFLLRSWRDEAVSAEIRRLAVLTLVFMGIALWGDGMALSVMMGLTHLYSVDQLEAAVMVVAHWRQPLIWGFFTCLLVWLGIYGRQLLGARAV